MSEQTVVSDEVYRLLKEIEGTLEDAKEGLRLSYQVCDYPANGESIQDAALDRVNHMLTKLKQLL